MSWNQNGGWKGGGPWGQGPSSSGGGGRSDEPQDIEELLRRSQDRFKEAMPGGLGPAGALAILVLVLLGIGYFGFTVRINPDEVGVVQRFGKLDREVYSGLNFRWPYPIEQVTVVPYTRQNQVEIGSAVPTAGTFGQVRVQSRPDESLMLTGDGNIVDVNFTVQWSIKDAAAYLFNVRQPGGGVDASSNVKAVAESAMREVIGKNDLLPIFQTRQQIASEVKELMQTILDKYGSGIAINQVNLQKVDPPAAVISAFQDVQAARVDMERFSNVAKTYANRVVPEAAGERQRILQNAQGYKEQVINEARGATDRFLKIFEEYVKAPDVTRRRMYFETMEKVLAGVDKVVIDEKAGGVGGVVPYLPLHDLTRGKEQSGGQR